MGRGDQGQDSQMNAKGALTRRGSGARAASAKQNTVDAERNRAEQDSKARMQKALALCNTPSEKEVVQSLASLIDNPFVLHPASSASYENLVNHIERRNVNLKRDALESSLQALIDNGVIQEEINPFISSHKAKSYKLADGLLTKTRS